MNKTTSGEHDPFEEFEFRPLSEGLGFYKKPEIAPTKPSSASSRLAQSGNGSSAANPSSVQQNVAALGLSSPLPRPELQGSSQTLAGASLGSASPASPGTRESLHDSSLTNSQGKKIKIGLPQVGFEESSTKSKTSNQGSLQSKLQVSEYVSSFSEPAAILLDCMLVAALFLLCLISLILTTKVDLFANLVHPDANGLIYLSMSLLMGFVTWSYLLITRLFNGSTAGEWVFDQQLGSLKEQSSLWYGPKVALRSLIVVVTGFLIFPALSYALRRDVLGSWLNLSLVEKKSK